MRNLEILARNLYFPVIWKFSASPVSFAKIPVGVRSLSLIAVAILAQDAGGSANALVPVDLACCLKLGDVADSTLALGSSSQP